MRKGKFLKQFWFLPSVIEALNFCRKERNFRSNREYIERLILEDQERIKNPKTDPVLDQIKALKEDLDFSKKYSFYAAYLAITELKKDLNLTTNLSPEKVSQAVQKEIETMQKEFEKRCSR